MPDYNNISLEFRNKFLSNQLSFNRKYRFLFNKVADDIARLLQDPSIRFSKSFDFSKPINTKVTAIITDFHKKALELTEEQIGISWDLSNEKNDFIAKDYLKLITGMKAAQEAAYFLPNKQALKAFIGREHGTETLSDSVWKIAKQLRGEMEIHLGLGIANGDSAQVLSRRIRQYLNDPTALFRRVRDSAGNLVASQKMIENAPGTGTYNSAYKNAMRVARTETNQAYLLADHIRWSQMDMVIGVKISLSAQHPDYNYPEICEVLAGVYPKTFVFVGWHPNCLCHKTPIMASEENFMAYLRGEEALDIKQITDYPEAFEQYVKDNFERYSNYKSVPYWMRDNKEVINNIMDRESHNSIAKLFIEQRNKSTRSEFLSPLTVDSLKDSKIIMLNNNQTGCVISPDGNLENVFNNDEEGQGANIIQVALNNGAKKLDCFDGYLPGYYKQFGFEEVSRIKWDDQYAPPNWSYKLFGRPDIVYMQKK